MFVVLTEYILQAQEYTTGRAEALMHENRTILIENLYDPLDIQNHFKVFIFIIIVFRNYKLRKNIK